MRFRGQIIFEYPIKKNHLVEGLDEGMGRRAVEQITAFRVDAIIKEENGNVWIVEAKRKLNMCALGQLLCYKALLDQEVSENAEEIKLAAVYRDPEPLLEPIYRSYGIHLFRV